jgi:hypothetical protein
VSERVSCPQLQLNFPRFINKAPCAVAHVIEDSVCPPDGPHHVKDYPIYYDPIYFPHEYHECFESALNFCIWLKNALKTHHVHCLECETEFTGLVTYDGLNILIFFYATGTASAKHKADDEELVGQSPIKKGVVIHGDDANDDGFDMEIEE